MNLDSDKMLEDAIRIALTEGMKDKLKYNNQIDKLLTDSIQKHDAKFRSMLEDAIGSCVNDTAFRAEIAGAVRALLAKTLVQRFGGEIEKQVNALKSDPTTRARITIAIEEIVRAKT